MGLFYKVDEKTKRKDIEKLFVEHGLDKLQKQGFKPSPFSGRRFGEYYLGSRWYELCHLDSNSILINLRIDIDDTRISCIITPLRLRPKVTSIDELKGLDGLGLWFTRLGYDIRINLGKFLSQSGYKKQLEKMAKNIQRICTKDLQSDALNFYKKNWGEYFVDIPTSDWEGNPIDEDKPVAHKKNKIIKQCKKNEVEIVKGKVSVFNSKYSQLASIVSYEDENVISEIEDFFDNPCEYLYNNNLDKPQKIHETFIIDIVLHILEKHNYILHIDWQESLEQYVEDGYLQELHNGVLKNLACLDSFLEQREEKEYYSLADLHKGKYSKVIECINTCGYTVFDINDNSDMYHIGLIKLEDVEKIKSFDMVKIIPSKV